MEALKETKAAVQAEVDPAMSMLVDAIMPAIEAKGGMVIMAGTSLEHDAKRAFVEFVFAETKHCVELKME